ncbi:MAG: glycosyltransferase family 2 protein [candidate division KSB1 bacterium]|nr:glycosyltransferase family 2 protein [candidate division KSB1 bacterium]MDZ7303425.1 glycosyltransferase family 2 protein [candidate division KSB1 bacterium]MDZ7312507.1 glycosyltransferase family 2 protein [candidate division KSB1 bacterium]
METIFQSTVLALYSVSLVILFIFGAHGYLMVYLYNKYRMIAKKEPAPLHEFPKVTVQLPVFNEVYVVERLIRAACDLDYPRHLLEIQVLDDSTDETFGIAQHWVAHYQKQGYQITLRHRDHRQGYKAGALREGLAVATGEFIAIFDADFVPPRDFLKRTLAYFDEPKIGAVQARWGHLNGDYSVLTRAQAIGLDGHFVVEQTARNGAGFFINFNGTAGVWRRECILDAGNWSDDTLTEDLDLSYRAQLRGWKFKFLPDTICHSEIPAEIGGVKAQQFRWTKGAMETAKKILPQLWKSPLPLKIKLQSTVHLTNNLVFPVLLILGILNLPLVLIKNQNKAASSLYFAIISILTLAFCGLFMMYLTSQREVYPDWRRRILYLPVFMAGSIGLSLNNTRAIVQGLFKQHSEFLRTPKYGLENRHDRFFGRKYFNAREQWNRVISTGLIEGLMTGYCLFGLGIAIHYRDWATIPLQGLYGIGFGFIAYMSLKHYLWPRVASTFHRKIAHRFSFSMRGGDGIEAPTPG